MKYAVGLFLAAMACGCAVIEGTDPPGPIIPTYPPSEDWLQGTWASLDEHNRSLIELRLEEGGGGTLSKVTWVSTDLEHIRIGSMAEPIEWAVSSTPPYGVTIRMIDGGSEIQALVEAKNPEMIIRLADGERRVLISEHLRRALRERAARGEEEAEAETVPSEQLGG